MPRTVLYESFSGNGMTCSPEAIFRYLAEDQDFEDLQHIWVLNDFERYSDSIAEFKDDARVKFVKYASHDYYRYLATSKFLVNNVSFPAPFSKRPDQIYVNTWHGVPLKKMGYDIPGRAIDAKNMVRNFLAADFLLSSSRVMTERMYLGAFKLNNVFQGTIVEEGLPRTDRQMDERRARREFDTILRNKGLDADDRKIILYAPTWKGESYFRPQHDSANLLRVVRHLTNQIDTTKYRIMVKPHQVVSASYANDLDLAPHILPNDVPTNVALGASAILITDYSSIFYDFLSLERPVLFYIPDLDEFRNYRDLYDDPDRFVGSVSTSVQELGIHLLAATKSPFCPSPEYRHEAERFTSRDDGVVCKRVVDVVFRGKRQGYRMLTKPADGRRRVLIYIGGMQSNGITTSALNLLDNIDYARFDVTVLCPDTADPEKLRNISRVNHRSRLMFRTGNFHGGASANYLRLLALKTGDTHWASRLPMVQRIWRNEWNRCFGNAEFDHLIDFSGYSPFWGLLLLSGPQATRSIWLHNDLAADALRSIEGGHPLKAGLHATFSLYRYFDNLVSVSPGLAEINRQTLNRWAPASRFVSAHNTINPSKILEMASLTEKQDGGDALCTPDSVSTNSDVLERLVRGLLEPTVNVPTKCESDTITIAEKERVTSFITVGRLSPEKNHLRLIRAFSAVHKSCPLTRLLIVGDGPLRSKLQAEIEDLGLDDSVKLVGFTNNPYALMRASDSFVLSSDYEGQPMVLLEALVLGLDVITTSFGSVNGALPEGTGVVVEPEVSALAAAMVDRIQNPVPAYTFDSVSYNKRAVQDFENIISR